MPGRKRSLSAFARAGPGLKWADVSAAEAAMGTPVPCGMLAFQGAAVLASRLRPAGQRSSAVRDRPARQRWVVVSVDGSTGPAALVPAAPRIAGFGTHRARVDRRRLCSALGSRACARAKRSDLEGQLRPDVAQGPSGTPATRCFRWSEGGSGGIRTPGPSRDARFQGECIRPLCHASRPQATRTA